MSVPITEFMLHMQHKPGIEVAAAGMARQRQQLMSEGPHEIAVAMIGFLSKAFRAALLIKTVEEHYAELIRRT
jgi:hypothetical protein